MEISETRFSVKGMKCGGCVAKATEAVSKLPGYQACAFDLKTATAVVTGSVDPQAVVQALNQAGYPAEVVNG
ncbi:MAG TPA: heavy metal-associated domain-containing protein [Sulfuricaulis sp.]|nr:cation transporter [Gammaproteobacteria bacterium]MDH5488229.1 cation transporter [Gammaproteobacteria bacterium]HEU5338867.1 heavy metal-associated domain-containing protein [Sulfuricaulis sp.]